MISWDLLTIEFLQINHFFSFHQRGLNQIVEEEVDGIEILEVENRKLIETNFSLEPSQKMHEEDVKIERDNMNKLVFYY